MTFPIGSKIDKTQTSVLLKRPFTRVGSLTEGVNTKIPVLRHGYTVVKGRSLCQLQFYMKCLYSFQILDSSFDGSSYGKPDRQNVHQRCRRASSPPPGQGSMNGARQVGQHKNTDCKYTGVNKGEEKQKK